MKDNNTEKTLSIDELPSSVVTSPELHEQNLDQVLVTPVILDSQTRQTIRFHDFIPGKTQRVFDFIARDKNLSYTQVTATAIVHGHAILIHEQQDTLAEIQRINDETIFNKFEMFEAVHENIMVKLNYGRPNQFAHCDSGTKDAISRLCMLLNTNASQIVTACMIASLNGYPVLPADILKNIEKHHNLFGYICNERLVRMKECKY